ncbi:MAG: FAD-dependent oxidoreductase [Candidatus Omnitrophica bacterium]|nr:FAD-dependent oxidoreductase [Candidatus Omnitrophota bacterium]MDD5661257.1 FAD-dependent oxidoreductase [Candidatus Omnitrophota bacterium]
MNKIIIIGAGFAGLSAAGRLAKCGLDLKISIFDKKSHSDFLPLIPDCIGRGVNPEILACDISNFCRKRKIEFIREEVNAVDFKSKLVSTPQAAYAYDFLIIASGTQSNFFSNQPARQYGFPLNSVNDAKTIMKALKDNDKFTNFIICGAGYTGVEAAANFSLYFKKQGLIKRVIMVERAQTILGPLPEWMKSYIERNLLDMGIEILVNSVVENIQEDNLRLSSGRVFDHAMLVWVPGVRTADFIHKLGVNKNPQGRIVVDEYLRINQDCFCAGDTALFTGNNNSLRMAVQFAITEGEHAAGNIARSIKNLSLKKFRPLDLGYIIPLANNKSCGRVFGLNLRGILPTLLHYIMCIFRLRGLTNKAGIISSLIKGLCR